jgi:uncharacterized protein YndB with AHSA1/START domain
MPAVTAEADVRCSPETLFDLILDLRGQDRWLSPSSAYHGTLDISSEPTAVGTTYREPGPFGVRHGRIVELHRPTTVAFHQPMTMRLHTGTVDILLRYALTPAGGSTHLRRTVALTFPWLLKPFQRLIVPEFRKESERTVRALKAYADGSAQAARGGPPG